MNTPQLDNATFVRHFPQHAMMVSDEGPSFPRTHRESTAVRNAADDDLATRIALGDIDAASHLAARYTARLVDVAFKIVGDAQEAECIAEAAIEDACRGWPPERGQVLRWLTRLVRRRAKARMRVFCGLAHADA